MIAERVISGLIARGLPEHIALGVAGNMAVESEFDPGINERNPVVPGSRGGFGLNQWTGPRRRQYEQFAQARGVDPSDLDTQLDFTMWELGNTEKSAATRLSTAQTPEEAARIYSESFLRPGIPHLDRRIAETRRLSGNAGTPTGSTLPAYQSQNTLAQGTSFNPEAQNALAQPQLRLQSNLLDPRAFALPTQPVNRLAYT